MSKIKQRDGQQEKAAVGTTGVTGFIEDSNPLFSDDQIPLGPNIHKALSFKSNNDTSCKTKRFISWYNSFRNGRKIPSDSQYTICLKNQLDATPKYTSNMNVLSSSCDKSQEKLQEFDYSSSYGSTDKLLPSNRLQQTQEVEPDMVSVSSSKLEQNYQVPFSASDESVYTDPDNSLSFGIHPMQQVQAENQHDIVDKTVSTKILYGPSCKPQQINEGQSYRVQNTDKFNVSEQDITARKVLSVSGNKSQNKPHEYEFVYSSSYGSTDNLLHSNRLQQTQKVEPFDDGRGYVNTDKVSVSRSKLEQNYQVRFSASEESVYTDTDTKLSSRIHPLQQVQAENQQYIVDKTVSTKILHTLNGKHQQINEEKQFDASAKEENAQNYKLQKTLKEKPLNNEIGYVSTDKISFSPSDKRQQQKRVDQFDTEDMCCLTNNLLLVNRQEAQKEDEIDIFGKYIVAELKNLPHKQRIFVQKSFTNIIYEVKERLPSKTKDLDFNSKSNLEDLVRSPLTEMAEKKMYPDLKTDLEKARTSKKNQSKAQKNAESKSEENEDVSDSDHSELHQSIDAESISGYDRNTDKFTTHQISNLRSRTREEKGLHEPTSPRNFQLGQMEKKEKCNQPTNPIENRSRHIPHIVSSPLNSHTQDKKAPEASLRVQKYIKFIISVLFFALIPVFIWFSNLNTSAQFDVSTLMSNLKDDFNEQPSMTFKIVQNAITNVVKTDPKAPAIIMLLASKGAERVSEQFARQIVESISKPEEFVSICGDSFRMKNADVAKKDIDDIISENLSEDKLRAVWVDRLDYIPADAALMFHTYCDHENAPFKKAVYVMTVSSGKTVAENNPKAWDVMLQEHLNTVWNTAGNDQISSLLSRLTVSVAAIVPKQ